MEGGNELLAMELVFENVLEPLSPPELAAVMSALIFERENSGDVVIQNAALRKLVEKMETMVTRIYEVERGTKPYIVDIVFLFTLTEIV